jgi:hypothetical protein
VIIQLGKWIFHVVGWAGFFLAWVGLLLAVENLLFRIIILGAGLSILSVVIEKVY